MKPLAGRVFEVPDLSYSFVLCNSLRHCLKLRRNPFRMIRERALFFLHTYTQMSGWGRVKVEKFPKNAAKHENSPPPPP